MSYATVVEMKQSASLNQRVAACAAEQGVSDAQQWAFNQLPTMCADPQFGWPAKWESGALYLAQNNGDRTQNTDLGERGDVITDTDILAAVQALKAV